MRKMDWLHPDRKMDWLHPDHQTKKKGVEWTGCIQTIEKSLSQSKNRNHMGYQERKMIPSSTNRTIDENKSRRAPTGQTKAKMEIILRKKYGPVKQQHDYR